MMMLVQSKRKKMTFAELQRSLHTSVDAEQMGCSVQNGAAMCHRAAVVKRNDLSHFTIYDVTSSRGIECPFFLEYKGQVLGHSE